MSDELRAVPLCGSHYLDQYVCRQPAGHEGDHHNGLPGVGYTATWENPRGAESREDSHGHVTVDEETYWGLMYLHLEVKRLFDAGELADGALKYLSDDAERRLAESRRRNEADPEHHRA